MQKKLTITVDERVYDGLHTVVGPRRISQFIESLVRPFVIGKDLEVAYQQMAQEEAREALVKVRGKKHKAMADQLTTVSKTRLENRVGPTVQDGHAVGGVVGAGAGAEVTVWARLSKTDMQAIEQAIKVQLELT